MWTGFVSSLPGSEVDANPKGRHAPSHPRAPAFHRKKGSTITICSLHRTSVMEGHEAGGTCLSV